MTKCLTFLNYHGGARYTQLVGGELASYRAFLFFFKVAGGHVCCSRGKSLAPSSVSF